MPYTGTYGVARKIRIPMVKRGVVDHAVSADWTPAAGDVKISKDGGAAANVTNLPTAIAMGNSTLWEFSLTATEMQAQQIEVTIADSTTKAVEDSAFGIETTGGIRRNTAFPNFMFLMTDTSNHNPQTGLTGITVTRAIDGGAFGAGGLGSVTEVANGYYKCDLAASDLNGSVIVFRASKTGSDDRFVEIYTGA